MAGKTGIGAQVREQFSNNLIVLEREHEHTLAKLNTRNALLGVLGSGAMRQVQELMQDEMEKAKEHLADLDFYNEDDVLKARELSAQLKTIKVFVRVDELKQEVIRLAQFRDELELRIGKLRSNLTGKSA